MTWSSTLTCLGEWGAIQKAETVVLVRREKPGDLLTMGCCIDEVEVKDMAAGLGGQLMPQIKSL